MERRDEQGTRNKEPTNRKGDDIEARMLEAVESVRCLLPSLQRDAASKHVAKQLWRAATGGGANYEEARSAESRGDFIHKLRIATKELREAHYWLRVIRRSDWVRPATLDHLVGEFNQLIAIFVTSARTAKSRSNS